MTITKLDRPAVNLLAEEARIALEAIATRHGLTLQRDGGRFDPEGGTFSPKFIFVAKTATGVPSDFANLAPLFGLKAEDFGREFSTFQGRYTICGIKPRNRKYPILGRCTSSGKIYKFQERTVRRAQAS